jgi:hypothetical protein
MNPKLKRTLLYVGLIWAIGFACLIVVTPAHYTETSHTGPSVTHVTSGDVNGGTIGVLLGSATHALLFTVVVSIFVLAVGSIALGLKQFLSRLGVEHRENTQDSE